MAPFVLFFVLAVPFIEILVALEIASHIGILLTVLLLIAMSLIGIVATRREGVGVWRRARSEMAEGRVPTKELLDGTMVGVGGLLLTLPGFVTGVIGALLLLPPIRALLRPLVLAWGTRRAGRAMRSGRLAGTYFGSTVDSDGRVHTYSGDMSDVIDAEGWDVGPDEEPGVLPPGENR